MGKQHRMALADLPHPPSSLRMPRRYLSLEETNVKNTLTKLARVVFQVGALLTRRSNGSSYWPRMTNLLTQGGIALAIFKHHRVVLKMAAALGVVLSGIALPQTASADLFAVTDNDEVAEQLHFGPGALTPLSNAFLSGTLRTKCMTFGSRK